MVEPRVLDSFASIDPRQWQALERSGNPFLHHAFLAGLEQTGSIGPHAGWRPHHLALFDGDELLAFAPTYAKENSHGEFVFDWAWADAYRRNGLPYYPKLLTGIPYTPVTGPRLLVRTGRSDAAELRKALAEFAISCCSELGYSTWHCNFASECDIAAVAELELLHRGDWQFHWVNREYRCFDDFTAGLRSRKRKNIRRERQRIQQSGIRFEWRSGAELEADDIDFVYACYLNTFQNYGNYPALKRSFFESIARRMGERFQVVFARRGGETIAMAVFLCGGGRLYGRYWGCTEEIAGLHFETAYYQGIEFCIDHGIAVFESGAQGEHKIPRGFLPTRTRSVHHVEHPLFREAIAEHLVREKAWLDEYREQLKALDPFRSEQP